MPKPVGPEPSGEQQDHDEADNPCGAFPGEERSRPSQHHTPAPLGVDLSFLGAHEPVSTEP